MAPAAPAGEPSPRRCAAALSRKERAKKSARWRDASHPTNPPGRWRLIGQNAILEAHDGPVRAVFSRTLLARPSDDHARVSVPIHRGEVAALLGEPQDL